MKRRYRGIRPVAALVAVLSGCGSAQVPPAAGSAPVGTASRPPATADVLRGERLLSEGKVGEAQKIFEQAIADDPDDPRAWLDLGLAREEAGDPKSAERAYRRAIEIDPSFAEAFNNLGVIQRERGALADAVVTLRRAVALDPELAAARFNLGLAHEDRGSLGDAEREYLAAIELLPADPVPRINLAMMYLEMGRSEDAATQLGAARSLVGGDVLLSLAVGEGLRRAGLPQEAVSVLRTALNQTSHPPPTELLAELALAYYATDDLDSAEAMMRRAVAQDEIDPALQYAYGSILAKRGQLDRARAHFRRALKLDPDGPYAERARARLQSLK